MRTRIEIYLSMCTNSCICLELSCHGSQISNVYSFTSILGLSTSWTEKLHILCYLSWCLFLLWRLISTVTHQGRGLMSSLRMFCFWLTWWSDMKKMTKGAFELLENRLDDILWCICRWGGSLLISAIELWGYIFTFMKRVDTCKSCHLGVSSVFLWDIIFCSM